MRRALLCACSEYGDPAFTPLKYPLNDVDQFQLLLEDSELCGFDEVAVLKNVSKSEVHEAIENLTAESATDDFILFYFSGHGKLAPDGSVSLVLADTKERRLHSTGLLDDQLRALFNASRAQQRVIILDCCYSGAVGEEGFKRTSEDAIEALAQQIKGTFVLSASSKFQPAMECDDTQGSAFTACLIEGVRTGAAAEHGTGKVTLSKLGEYLTREVPLRSNQQPKFWDFGGVGAAVFARVPRSFDREWTEQTVKRLRQMMGREQIDDQMFVDLQQVVRAPRSSVKPHMLELIDDLVQRRIKPLPFMRQWQQQLAALAPAASEPKPIFFASTDAATSAPREGQAPASGQGDRAEDAGTAGRSVAGSGAPARPTYRHLLQLLPGALGLVAALLILQVKESFDPATGYTAPSGGLGIWGAIFAMAQASMVSVIWQLLPNRAGRTAVIVASLAAAWGVLAGIASLDLMLVQSLSVPVLALSAILLIVLHLQGRGLVFRKREAGEGGPPRVAAVQDRRGD